MFFRIEATAILIIGLETIVNTTFVLRQSLYFSFSLNHLIVQWTGEPGGRRQLYVIRAESRKVSKYYLLVTDTMNILISENESEKTSLTCESH